MANTVLTFFLLAIGYALAAQQAPPHHYGAGPEASPADLPAASNATAALPASSHRAHFHAPHSYCYKPVPSRTPVALNVTASTPAAAPGKNTTATAYPDVTITEVVSRFTTNVPQPTSFAVNNVTYTATASTVITVTDCKGGCRVTRAASEINKPTVTAIVSQYTTSIAGPFTSPSPLTLQGPVTIQGSATTTVVTVSKATVVTVSSCPGGCTVTTALSALVSSMASGYAPYTAAASAGTISPIVAANGTATRPIGGPTGPAAGPGSPSNSPKAPAQTGGAAANSFSFGIVLLAWAVAFL